MKKSLFIYLALLVMAASMLTACAGTASTSLAGDWKLVSYGSAAAPTPADPATETSLTFAPDGTFNGNVGCNSFNGDYQVDGSTITFGPIVSTMMACADPMMEQEGVVFNVFTNSATFKLDGELLTVTSADGANAVVFAPK